MSHDHSHNHHDSTGNIKTAFFLNLVFTLIEIVGGLFTNSLAILSDALHDLGDTFSLGLSWYLDRVSKKKHDNVYSYGYKRFSLLAAVINSIVLVVGSIYILTEALPRLMNPEHSNAQGMFVLALVGIGINGLAVLRLRSGKSMNERVVTWHLLEDVLGWVAVLIVSIVMYFWDLHILDPLLSLGITLYVLWNVVKNLRKTVKIFLQSVPDSVDTESLEQSITALSKVQAVHDTHIWSLDGEYNVLTTHVAVNKDTSQEEVYDLKCEIKKIAHEGNIEHVTIEVEYEGEDCTTSQH
ncbi:MAG TPA: cation diffusion facilitator family transporter [Patescibacteria group bacterium]